jgi:hypothetical protein
MRALQLPLNMLELGAAMAHYDPALPPDAAMEGGLLPSGEPQHARRDAQLNGGPQLTQHHAQLTKAPRSDRVGHSAALRPGAGRRRDGQPSAARDSAGGNPAATSPPPGPCACAAAPVGG